MKRVKHEKSTARKKFDMEMAQREKSTTRKKFIMKKIQHEISHKKLRHACNMKRVKKKSET